MCIYRQENTNIYARCTDFVLHSLKSALIVFIKGSYKELSTYDTLQRAVAEVQSESFSVAASRQEKVLQNAVQDLFPGYYVATNSRKESGLLYPILAFF